MLAALRPIDTSLCEWRTAATDTHDVDSQVTEEVATRCSDAESGIEPLASTCFDERVGDIHCQRAAEVVIARSGLGQPLSAQRLAQGPNRRTRNERAQALDRVRNLRVCDRVIPMTTLRVCRKHAAVEEFAQMRASCLRCDPGHPRQLPGRECPAIKKRIEDCGSRRIRKERCGNREA